MTSSSTRLRKSNTVIAILLEKRLNAKLETMGGSIPDEDANDIINILNGRLTSREYSKSTLAIQRDDDNTGGYELNEDDYQKLSEDLWYLLKVKLEGDECRNGVSPGNAAELSHSGFRLIPVLFLILVLHLLLPWMAAAECKSHPMRGESPVCAARASLSRVGSDSTREVREEPA